MTKLALAVALALALAASPALAQKAGASSKLPIPIPIPTPTIAPGGLMNNITSDTLSDLAAGKAFFDSVKDATGSACYGDLIAELTAAYDSAQPANGATLPKLHLFYSFALGYEFAQNLKNSNSALATACAPLALQVKLSIDTLVTDLTTGALSTAKIAALLGLP